MKKRVAPFLEPVGQSPRRFCQDLAIPVLPLAAKPPRFKNLGYPLLVINQNVPVSLSIVLSSSARRVRLADHSSCRIAGVR